MDKILLFAGTTEGRNLAEFLEKIRYRRKFVWQRSMERRS